jgi:CRISPR/Cas system-associated exonuclease Cas4 (RecB family)
MILEDGSPFKEHLLQLLTEEYGKPRDGVHVSDILMCLREQVFRKRSPIPINEKELSFYALGEGAHLALERLAGKGGAISEKEVIVNGVKGTIDVFNNVPIEIKTTRAKVSTPRPFHLKQLGYYMAMTYSNVGVLLYIMMNDYEQPFRFKTMTMTNDELELERSEIEERAKVFMEAISSSDPFLAPHVKADPELGWKCKSCKYRAECWSREN